VQNREQPSPQIGTRLELLEACHRTLETILNQIIGAVGRTGQRACVAPQRGYLTFDRTGIFRIHVLTGRLPAYLCKAASERRSGTLIRSEINSTSASIRTCSTASATARRKSPSPAFCTSSANAILSSVIAVVLGWVKRYNSTLVH
jgi:hypothetical protein